MTVLTDIALATAERYLMLPGGAPVLAMVSGGGDSVALLHMLARGVFGEQRICALHVNHMLRADESEADEEFVRKLCGSLGIECRVVRYDVSAYAADEGLNLEDAGRRIRRRFASEELDALCSEAGVAPAAGRIAIAHTRDDRVETFFMRAIAGSGTGGLGSIARVSGRIVRPLIDCDRAEVRAWLREQGVEWRTDSTNDDTDRTRAYVRHELVPVAERLNPRMRESLARTMDLLADDDSLLSGMADAFSRDFADVGPDGVAFEVEWMATLERTMARRTVRSALAKAFPEASRLESSHVEALVDGLSDESFARDLPGGLRAWREYGKLMVRLNGADEPRVAPALLPLPGIADLGHCGTIAAEPAEPGDVSGDAHSVVIDVGEASDLLVDSLREGDRMQPLGMEGSRKLSDMLVDAKVAQRLRCAVPVVRDGERIVWLTGVRMSEEYRVTAATRRAFRLTWSAGQTAGQAE